MIYTTGAKGNTFRIIDLSLIFIPISFSKITYSTRELFGTSSITWLRMNIFGIRVFQYQLSNPGES